MIFLKSINENLLDLESLFWKLAYLVFDQILRTPLLTHKESYEIGMGLGIYIYVLIYPSFLVPTSPGGSHIFLRG